VILLDPDAKPIIGHRGASGEYPENTLLAFDHALVQGADALELDVRATADGFAAVMHDAAVDRTTSGVGPVRSFTAERLRDLDAGRGERVPLLDEVLERYPDVPIILEVKEPAAAEPALAALRRHHATGRVVIGSFVHAALRPFRAAGCHCSASRRETALSWAASRVGVSLPGGGFEGFTVPERHRGLTIVDRRFVRAARHRGRPVHVWTVDDVTEADRLRSCGVAGIISNYPDRMRGLRVGSDVAG